MTDRAPFFDDLAEGPEGGEAYWLAASDGVRIRVGLWPWQGTEPCHGTVFILPGRTECIEKYGRGAADLAARGFASLAIDWRGQGIAERLLKDRRIGHVDHFPDYQKDLEAVIALAQEKNMPKPWFMLAHSMGGAIGLRALIEGKPFTAAAFSGPMWGIGFTPFEKITLRAIAPILARIGLRNTHAVGTKPEPYMMWQPFDGNTLTSDAEMYRHMIRQIEAQPDLGLGGPSLNWVLESVAENTWAKAQPAPKTPAICFLGSDETIVDTGAVREVAGAWPACELVEVEGARHETPMETPAIRTMFYDRTAEFFIEHSR